ncbi:phosphate/phosphite/phosphonate ABC transporter substrate-binding protein [Oceanospirillaceae bacterium G-43]|uniref:Phosphate/phosphite/phosphonate ABC transporter substrate-binding protein n=2 Tax=Parathalassolituus penaei TaxID=2997323 RepID=A0A9X3EQJ6_9GAMM|nr:phosphate/phosphite/phosphonate ABC transporter substrate-binding protein [Parathalassolituus penaei]
MYSSRSGKSIRFVRAVINFIIALLLFSTASAYGESPLLRLAVISERASSPGATLAEMTDFHRRLGQHLAAAGISLAPLLVVDSIDQLKGLVRRHEVDAFFESMFATLDVSHLDDAWQPQLLMWRQGQRNYHSVFFVRNDSTITSLDDLSGKTVVFESARSTSAFHLPRLMLEQKGYQVLPDGQISRLPSRYVNYRFAESEINQAYWVDRQRADVGAFNDGDWQRLPESLREHLRIIGHTSPVPRWLFSLDTRLPAEMQAAVNRSLLQLMKNEDDRKSLQEASGVTQIEPLTAADRNNLAQWMEALHGQ